MKAFAVVLLCFFAAVQGRSTGAQVSTAAALGENPWVVHLRVAVSTRGIINTCVGSLINERFVLTSANCIRNFRFAWLRYGAVNVIKPELVTESNVVRTPPNFITASRIDVLVLIAINRVVHSSDNISPVALAAADAEIPATARFCGYGTAEGRSGFGETLSCSDVAVEQDDDGNLVAVTGASEFDIGSPLISDGVQYGVLSRINEKGESVFLKIAPHLEWITSTANLPRPVSSN